MEFLKRFAVAWIGVAFLIGAVVVFGMFVMWLTTIAGTQLGLLLFFSLVVSIVAAILAVNY